MNRETLIEEIEKLSKRFDRKYYPSEVINIIWNEVKDLDIFWFKKQVATFLGLHKPPLLPEFKEVSRIEKDKKRAYRSVVYENNSIFTLEEKKFLFDILQAVGSGKIKQPEVGLIVNAVQNVIESGNKKGEMKSLMLDIKI